MLTGIGLYLFTDVLIKYLMTMYSMPQVTVLRALVRVIPLFLMIPLQGGFVQVLGTKHPIRHIIRLIVNLAYTYSFMYAMNYASLTTVYTLSYTSAFFMIILSTFILKEKTSYEKWVAVAIGFIGAVIAMKPTTKVIELSALIVLCGSFLGSLNKILMRRLAATEHSLAIAIYPNLMMIVVTLPMIVYSNTWMPITWNHWGCFACIGVFAAIGQYAMAQALRFAQGSTLAPMDYSSLFWVGLIDYFFWHTTPGLEKILGATIIIASNLFILYRTKQEQSTLTCKVK